MNWYTIEVKDNLTYRVISSTVRAVQRNHVSNKQTKLEGFPWEN